MADKGYRPAVGEKIVVGKQVAVCRFVGATQFAQGEWIGAELDDATGKNDGTVQGVSYFKCRAGHGIFIKQAMCRKYEENGEKRMSVSPDKRMSLSPDKPRSPAVKQASEVKLNPEETEATRVELIEAVEDNNLDKIKELLPIAERKGVSPAELGVAAQTLTSQARDDLLGEMEDIKSLIKQLSQSIEEIAARAAAVEHVAATAGKGGNGAAPAPTPSTTLDASAMDAWMKQHGPKLQKDIIQGLENDVKKVLDKATARVGGTQASGQSSGAVEASAGPQSSGGGLDPGLARCGAYSVPPNNLGGNMLSMAALSMPSLLF